MTPKIKTYEELRISIAEGLAEVHISEISESNFHITISENAKEAIHIGIPYPDGEGTLYMYWEDIKRIVMEHEYGKENEINSEKEPEKNNGEKCEETTTYKDPKN